ncbi:MAG TPA: DUF4157 domain-containing protein [Allosphingosinicella sp.]|nr:DUF4157 domain-containing protein [Allosphingosinicella sp.]
MRPLTEREAAMVAEAMPGPLPLAAVRLLEGSDDNPVPRAAFHNGNTAITLRRTIYFGRHYHEDFAAADPHARGLFLHEMTHVWQYSRLGVAGFAMRYVRDLCACRFRARAMYRYEPGEGRFGEARLEAQAQMVGDYAEARARGDEVRARLLERSLAGSGFYGL